MYINVYICVCVLGVVLLVPPTIGFFSPRFIKPAVIVYAEGKGYVDVLCDSMHISECNTYIFAAESRVERVAIQQFKS